MQTTYYGVPVHLVREVWMAMMVSLHLYTPLVSNARRALLFVGAAPEKEVDVFFHIPVIDCKDRREVRQCLWRLTIHT